jgi:uncharacterized DUF497 family protein
MSPVHIVWDLEEEPDGNVQHIAEHGVSAGEVEEVIYSSLSNTTASKTSAHRVTFGYTGDGRYLAVVWEHIQVDPLTIYPITAYDAPEPRRTRRK